MYFYLILFDYNMKQSFIQSWQCVLSVMASGDSLILSMPKSEN